MDTDEYIAQRLDDQIEWYDKKSLHNQRWHKILRVFEIVGAALIPFATAVLAPEPLSTRIAIGGLGVVVTVVAATLDLFRFQVQWIEYRTTCETLKKEKFLFLTASEPYLRRSGDNLQLLVQRVETLIANENTNWGQGIRQRGKEEG